MPKDTVKEKILEKADIVEIVSGYSRLQSRGGRLFGLCPFHKEKTPSFSVNPDQGFFHCFGCGKGGNVIDFVMSVENLTFAEALRYLATKLGIPMDSYTGGRREHQEIDRYQVMDYAAQLYSSALEKNAEAKAYLRQRGLTDAHIRQFSLGYAPKGWDNLVQAMHRRQIPDTVLNEVGLIVPQKTGSGFYDRFRHRIMFPIRNTLGRVIAFGGRALDPQDHAKYLNSNETTLFSKSKVLYLLDQAKKVLKDKGAILVEGYMDAIALHIHGFDQTVANLGTALTKDHTNILRRYTSDFTLLYDGDTAGINAAMKGVETFLEMGYSPKVVLLPQGKDPDDFIKAEGKEAMQALLDAAGDGFDFYLQQVVQRHNVETPQGKSNIVADMVVLIDKITEPILLQDYLHHLARRIGSDPTTLQNSIRKKLKKLAPHAPTEVRAADKPVNAPDPHRLLKEGVIRLLALAKGLIQPGVEQPTPMQFQSSDLEEIRAFFNPNLASTNKADRILHILLEYMANETDGANAVRLAGLFPESDMLSLFIHITENEPLPSSQKAIEKMRDEVMGEIYKAREKRRQRTLLNQYKNGDAAALQELNELILKKDKKDQS
ncbi:MAG: DNA primase [bacterium]|jgi:DNA primase|nr:DNA primase [bacterium]